MYVLCRPDSQPLARCETACSGKSTLLKQLTLAFGDKDTRPVRSFSLDTADSVENSLTGLGFSRTGARTATFSGPTWCAAFVSTSPSTTSWVSVQQVSVEGTRAVCRSG